MRTEMLPEFARPFKTKGHDVRKTGNEYYLYKVEHFRVSGKKNPVTKYVYIGRIDREKGLIPAHTQNGGDVIACLEYGLSDYIYSNYRRALQRTLFNTSGEMASDTIKIGIIRFIFGKVTLATLRASRLTHNDAERLSAMYASNARLEGRAKTLSEKIDAMLGSVFVTEEDKETVILGLRNMTAVLTEKGERIDGRCPSDVKEIFRKRGIMHE